MRSDGWSLVLCVGLAACSKSAKEDDNLIVDFLPVTLFRPIYTAYDGVHDYQVVQALVSSSPDDVDPLDPSTARWTVDETFVRRESDDHLRAGLRLTTKKSGQTAIHLSVKFRSGRERREETQLFISPANPLYWEKGDQRYAHAPPAHFDLSACELTDEQRERIPEDGACAACHEGENGLSWSPTPMQLEPYDGDRLIEMFRDGRGPYFPYRSAFLREVSKPDCVFSAFHSQPLSDEESAGLLWKLRSLTPSRAGEEVDGWLGL